MNKPWLWIVVAGAAALGLAWQTFAPKPAIPGPASLATSASIPSRPANPAARSHAPANNRPRAALYPRMALEDARRQEPANTREEALRRVLAEWARHDPAAAIAWAAQLADDNERLQAQECICLTLAERDPLEAVNFAIDSRLCDTDAGLLENLTAQWAARDFSTAHDWVRQQEPGEWRDGLMARVAFAGSQSDPATAARIVAEEMTPGPPQTEAAISVLHQWALRDVDAAEAWAATFPGRFRVRALSEIASTRKSRETALSRP